jgi:tetratricopeptide (TPR) repeat protein
VFFRYTKANFSNENPQNLGTVFNINQFTQDSASWMISHTILAAIRTMGQTSDSVESLYQQAQHALSQGRYAEAERAYERLSKLDPGTAEVRANLGLICFEERKFDQAVPVLRRALKLKPSMVKSQRLLAMSLSELGNFSEALPGLEKGFQRSSDREIKRMRGLQLERAYTGLKRDSQAVEVAMDLNRPSSEGA